MDRDTVAYYCDAAVDTLKRGSGIAVVVRNASGQILDAASCFLAGMTNNEAEYEAFILGLEMALARSERQVAFLLDSQIVIGQVAGCFAVRDAKLAPRCERAARLLARIISISWGKLPNELSTSHFGQER